MCRPRTQGGQRCYSEADKQLASVEAAYQAAATGPDAAALHKAIRKRDIALMEYASTHKGAENIAALADAARGRGDTATAGEWRRHLVRGTARRHRAADAYRKWKQENTPDAAPHSPRATASPQGPRCTQCGQWRGRTHLCLTGQTAGPTMCASHADESAVEETERLDRALYEHIPLTPDERATIHTDYNVTDPELTVMQARHDTVSLHDIDPLSAGAVVEPWAVAAKRDAIRQASCQLEHLPAAALLPASARKRRDTGTVSRTASGRLVYPDADSPTGYRYLVDETPAHTNGQVTLLDTVADSGVHADAAADVAARWAGAFTADPASPGAGLQESARVEFTDPARPARTWRERRERAVLRAQYAATQQWLADRGITEVTVHRGMGWGEDATAAGAASRQAPGWYEPGHDGSHLVEPALNPLSSVSTTMPVAEAFSLGANDADDRAVITTTIPAARIASTPRTGMGCLAEHELVVLPGPGQWRLTSDYL